ncbi:hypothetical protein J1614_003544 [Plenodomus biglobosus]|nr:hypothetical protein J1614_003544 [Plenodomus biglobosus]
MKQDQTCASKKPGRQALNWKLQRLLAVCGLSDFALTVIAGHVARKCTNPDRKLRHATKLGTTPPVASSELAFLLWTTRSSTIIKTLGVVLFTDDTGHHKVVELES